MAKISMLKFSKENVAKVLNKSGNYYFYDKNRNPLYLGWSAILRHRIQSYYQVDDFDEHPTKKALRPKIAYFSVIYRPLMEARKVEKLLKRRFPHKHIQTGKKG